MKPDIVCQYPPTKRSLSQRGLKHHYPIRLNRAAGRIEGINQECRDHWHFAYNVTEHEIDDAIRLITIRYMSIFPDATPKNLGRAIALELRKLASA